MNVFFPDRFGCKKNSRSDAGVFMESDKNICKNNFIEKSRSFFQIFKR